MKWSLASVLAVVTVVVVPAQSLVPAGVSGDGGASSAPLDLVTLFEDDFDGDALSDAWNVNPHTGHAVVADSRVTMDCETFCPLIWTKPLLAEIDPAIGPVEQVLPLVPLKVTYEFQYLAFTPFGVGLGASGFLVWQDFNFGGMLLRLFDQDLVVPADLQPHTVEFVWTGVQYDLYLDGVLKLSHPAALGLDSHFLWIGNLAECCPNGPYNEISVDLVRVSLIAPV